MTYFMRVSIYFAYLILISVGTSMTVHAEYRLKDYRANNYAVPPSQRALWSAAGIANLGNLVAFHSRADQIFSIKPVANSAESSKWHSPKSLDNFHSAV